METLKLGSIELDTPDNRRGDITLEDGRIVCDDCDITPCAGKVDRIQAIRDVVAMYWRKSATVDTWKLRLTRSAQMTARNLGIR